MWTDEQLMAINENGKNIIVSAGAGSGKTAVLSERVLKKLDDNIHINELLILTFTKAAAGEMKERIRKKIKKSGKHKEELDLLSSAYITTFDSYALSVVKKYHYVLGISKDINIIDNSILSPIKDNIMDEIFEMYYKENDKNFTGFIDAFTIKDDKEIKKSILSINNSLDMLYDKENYLDNYINNYYNEDKIKKDITLFENLITSKINNIKSIIDNNQSDYIDKLSISINNLLISTSYDEIKINSNIKLPRITKESTEEDKEVKEEIKSIIDDIKSMLVYENSDEIYQSIKSTEDYIKVIIDIIKDYDRRVKEYKNKYNVYEFVDIAKMAIDIVRNNDDIRKEIKYGFKEILLDEYQDTSDLQEEFISLISNNNVYMVGDIKQSIYRFRNANPMVFKDKYDKYSLHDGGIKIDLNKNFRSRKDVIDGINLLFNRVMDDIYGGCDYITSHQMIFGNTSYDKEGSTNEDYKMEVYNYNYGKELGFTKDEIEVFIIAKDIKDKVESNYLIYDKDNNIVRNITYSDIVILLDRSSNFDLFKKIFEYLSIPLMVYKDEKMTSDIDILTLSNIIKFIIKIYNKEYDKEFRYLYLSIGRSFIYRLSDNELFNTIKDNKIYESDIYIKAKSISDKLDILSITSIIDMICEVFDYYNKLITIGSIDKSIIKLDKLKEMANNTLKVDYTIIEFSILLDNLITSGYDITYNVGNNDSNAVKIMTIHKSKGLEFNLCYFANLYKSFNIRDIKERFIYNKNYGIITPYFNEGVSDTIYKYLLKEDYIKEEISEKIRLFYVALTRAKEKMIFINIEDDKIVKDKSKYRCFKDILDYNKDILNPYNKNINIDNINLSKDYNLIKQSNYKDELSNSDKINVGNLDIEYNIINEKSYSKKSNTIKTKEEVSNMEYGSYIHYILEVSDFINTKNNSDEENKIVSKLLNNSIFNNIKEGKIYKEYEFIYDKDNTTYHGIIDLLIVYPNYIDIVDYKLKNIDDDNYLKQLNGYKEYIEYKYKKDVNIYLYSIMDNKIKKL